VGLDIHAHTSATKSHASSASAATSKVVINRLTDPVIGLRECEPVLLPEQRLVDQAPCEHGLITQPRLRSDAGALASAAAK
jgi:hypothetical protein